MDNETPIERRDREEWESHQRHLDKLENLRGEALIQKQNAKWPLAK